MRSAPSLKVQELAPAQQLILQGWPPGLEEVLGGAYVSLPGGHSGRPMYTHTSSLLNSTFSMLFNQEEGAWSVQDVQGTVFAWAVAPDTYHPDLVPWLLQLFVTFIHGAPPTRRAGEF